MDKNSDHIINEALVRRYQSGDKEALKELIRRFNPHLQSKIYYQTKNRDSINDIAQECWYAIIHNLEDVKFQVGFEAWALNIARNKAVDWIRIQQKERKRQAGSENEIQHSIEEEENEIRNMQINELKRGMALISQAQRIVLELFYLENLSLKEISAILGISTGTIKSRLFNAREQLKKIINK